MKNKRILFISILSLILLVAFFSCKKTIKDPSKLKIGDTYVFELEANPSTGYSWVLIDDYDKSIAEFIKSEYVSKPGNALGRGGKEFFYFKIIGSGKTSINLLYKAPGTQDLSIDSKSLIHTIDLDIK